MFFLLRSLVPFFSFLFFASSLCYAGTLLHHLACNMSCVFCYACTLLHHLARNTGGRGGGGGGVLCSLVPLSKKTGTQVIDRKWKALKDFLPRNYHRKINGPHGSQVNLLLRKCVFQFCWRNSLKSPSPAQFLKHLAKLQSRKRQLVALVFKMLKNCNFS